MDTPAPPDNYQHDEKRLVAIFRSSREDGLYLYVDKQEGMARVPASLLERFGRPEPAMMLMLEPSRKLAQADAARVLAAIRDQGFYLQMPPLPDREMFAIRASNSLLGRQ